MQGHQGRPKLAFVGPHPHTFDGFTIRETYWIGRTPYTTRTAISELLQGSIKNRRLAINTMIANHPDVREFSVKRQLPAMEQGRWRIRNREVFDPVGLLLIARSSRGISKKLVTAVARLALAHVNGRIRRPNFAGRRLEGLKQELTQIGQLPAGPLRSSRVRDLAQREDVTPCMVLVWLRRLGYRSLPERDKHARILVREAYALSAQASETSARQRLLAIRNELGIEQTLATLFAWTADQRGRPERRSYQSVREAIFRHLDLYPTATLRNLMQIAGEPITMATACRIRQHWRRTRAAMAEARLFTPITPTPLTPHPAA